jgi:hypothetical protein
VNHNAHMTAGRLAVAALLITAMIPMGASGETRRETSAAPTQFKLGDDVFHATLTSRGWLGLRFAEGTPLSVDLIDARRNVLIAKSRGTLQVIPSEGDRVFIQYKGERPQGIDRMNVLAGRRVVPLAGVAPFEWVTTVGGHTLGVGNDGDKSSVDAKWHLVDLNGHRGRIVAHAERTEAAVGAVKYGDEIIVAVREPATMDASLGAKVHAVQDVLKGDGRTFAALTGPLRGALLHVNRNGRVVRREPFAPQRPIGLAATDDGWLVVICEGTPEHAFHDAVVLGRARGESEFRVLAQDLQMPDSVRQRGGWVCFVEMLDDARVVHCVDPGRALHVATQQRYGKDVQDETLAAELLGP